MTSDCKKIANRLNAAKSTGPKSKVGKKNAAASALKHGVYARELRVSDADKEEFESLCDDLLAQLTPRTPLQTVAFEQIVFSRWRCKLAIRFEMNQIEVQSNTTQKLDEHKDEERADARELQWYGASPEDLNCGIRLLKKLHDDVSRSGGLHLEAWKEEIIRSFGPDFFGALTEWKVMHPDAILLADQCVRWSLTFNRPLPPLRPVPPPAERKAAPGPEEKEPRVILDPKQQLQMMIKLIEIKMRHLVDLKRVQNHGLQLREQLPADFVPRYFTTTTRDLQKALDWFLYLQSKGL